MLQIPVRNGLIPRLSLIIVACCFLALGIAFASTPVAHAAPLKSASCGTAREGFATVYDSYNHDEGVVSLHYNNCNRAIWGTFLSNTNTWRTVYVYTMPTTSGFKEATYGWAPNTNFNAPSYTAGFSSCYYAEVDLVDNRGNNNWYDTSITCE